jgi:uncharacterized protein
MKEFNLPTIAAFYAGILGLLSAGLAIRVIMQRVRLGVESGDNGKPMMTQAIRAHGNFAEYVPLSLLVIAFTEILGGKTYCIHALGILLTIARGLSAIGLSRSLGPSFPRQAGASLSIAVTIFASFYAIVLSKNAIF